MRIFYLTLLMPLFLFLFDLIFSLFKVQKETWFLLLFGFLVALINGVFFFFLFKKARILAYFFQGTAFFIQILILIFLILS